MALVTTLLTVAAMLGGITILLWISAAFETRHLGSRPVGGPLVGPDSSDPTF